VCHKVLEARHLEAAAAVEQVVAEAVVMAVTQAETEELTPVAVAVVVEALQVLAVTAAQESWY
jgi:hypothetical protein